MLLLAAVTGTLLVLARPLDRALHPRLFDTRHAQGAQRAPLQPLVDRLRSQFGPAASFNLRLPQPGETLQVAVTGTWEGTVYLDPATGLERARRAAGEGFFQALFELHSTLFAGDAGRGLLAGAALGYLFILASGAVLWWPLRRNWRVPLRTGAMPFAVNAHRVVGAAFAALIIVSVVTGAYLAWRPLAGWVTLWSGAAAAAPAPAVVELAAMDARTIDAAVVRAQAQWPGGIATVVQVPAGAVAASRVRIRLPADPHPIGMSMVWLDASTARVRAVRSWTQQDTGTRAFSIVYPLHTGDLGGGLHLGVLFMTGLALAFLGVTGLWTWWRRGPGRQRARPPRGD